MLKFGKRFLKSYAHSPILGMACGLLFIIGSIVLGAHSLMAFFSIEGFVVVIGGVITVAFMSFEAEDVRAALAVASHMFKKTKRKSPENLHDDMTAIIYCARLVMEKGMRNLESMIGKAGIRDPFVRYGLTMVVSQYPAEEVRAMMETAADARYERDSIPVEILHSMASHAPAFGMIGTLIGMVAMLCNLSDDVSGIGSNLAVSFLSTLYGVVSARMVYMPAAAKLQHEIDQRRFRNYLVTEGMVMLVSKKTPMYIRDRLNSFLKPEAHDYLGVVRNVLDVEDEENNQTAAAA